MSVGDLIPRHKHEWIQDIQPYRPEYGEPWGWSCKRCGKERDEIASRRGDALQAKAAKAERDGDEP